MNTYLSEWPHGLHETLLFSGCVWAVSLCQSEIDEDNRDGHRQGGAENFHTHPLLVLVLPPVCCWCRCSHYKDRSDRPFGGRSQIVLIPEGTLVTMCDVRLHAGRKSACVRRSDRQHQRWVDNTGDALVASHCLLFSR